MSSVIYLFATKSRWLHHFVQTKIQLVVIYNIYSIQLNMYLKKKKLTACILNFKSMYNGLFQENPHILEKVGYKVDQYNAICQKKKRRSGSI